MSLSNCLAVITGFFLDRVHVLNGYVCLLVCVYMVMFVCFITCMFCCVDMSVRCKRILMMMTNMCVCACARVQMCVVVR